jgi:hypothetical protein
MGRWIRLLLVGSILLGPAAGTASALTLLDVLKLKAANISDDVLVAVIEADRTVFHLTPEDIVMLRGKGISDKVIIALLQTVNRVQPPPQPPMVPVEDARIPQLQPPAPVVVNVTQTVEQRVEQAEPRVVYQSVPYPVVVGPAVRRPSPRAPEPIVYWGFGGQRRADSWSTPQIERNERARQAAKQDDKPSDGKKDEKPIKK